MLIDAGQVFRVLVVSAGKHGVDMDSPQQIDAFLADPAMLDETAELIKQIYHMDHAERDELLYTLEVGANSAKIGRHSQSQDFKDNLLRKWLQDAATEGYQVVLLDGRALEEVGTMLQNEGLCDYRTGFFFECDPVVGARRTLGYAEWSYDELSDDEKHDVDQLVGQINARNQADAERTVQPVVPPVGAKTYSLTQFGQIHPDERHAMVIIDTSDELTKDDMVQSVVEYFERAFHVL
jgi:cytidylate kinase